MVVETVDEPDVRAVLHDQAVVIEVAGEIDRATAPLLEDAIDPVRTMRPRVVVDLSEASYVDSSTLNALVRAHGRLAALQVALMVVRPANPHVSKLFDLVRLPAGIALFDVLARALADDVPRGPDPSPA